MTVVKRINEYHKFIISGILLVCMGIVFNVYSNRQSRNLFLSQQRADLMEIAGAADKNLENILSRVQNQIYYITTDLDFKRAEKNYIDNGTKYELWNLLRYNSLCESDLISGIVVTKHGNVFLATKEEFLKNNFFYDSLGNYRMRLCKTHDGKYYMALGFKGNYEKLSYYALIDLQQLYMKIADNEMGSVNNIMLYNDKLDIIVASDYGIIRTSRLMDFFFDGNESLGKYIKSESNSTEETAEVLDITDDGERVGKKYVAVYPAGCNENRIFTLAVSTEYNRILEPLRSVNQNFFMSMAVFTAGMIILIYGIMLMRERHVIADRKLIELREKNEAMQELLDKTKQLEHVQRLELLGTMTSGISHEFNNLLTPIMGYSIMSLEMIPEGSEELSENIIEIYNASKKAKNIVKRISELSKKNSSDSLVPVDMDDLAERVLQLTNTSKPEDVKVVKQLSLNGALIRTNETQMTQVLMNLIINAYHAMENGGTLTIATKVILNNMLCISVKDTGTGIADDVLPHIFDPFFTTKEAGKGTGLGLAIVKNIIDELGGSIDIHSEVGKGTEFVIKLHIYNERPKEENETEA